MDLKEFIEKIETNDLLFLAWKESNLTPSQMEEAWGVIKSVLLDALFINQMSENKPTPLTEVLDRPEHVELHYQDAKGALVKTEKNPWICSICKKDTSKVEYDYLSGYDHLECVLINETNNDLPIKEEETVKSTEPVKETVKKVKKEKIEENSTKDNKTFLELLARGEYKTKD